MSAYIIIFLALASVDVSVEKLQYDVHANARLALRDDDPEETLKLWFLQNSLESTSQEPGPHGDDFHSLTWTALSRLGICAEGLAKDSKGAGIWPIAQHNLMLKMLRKPPLASRLTPFDAFQLGYQQRFVGIYDVLNRDEIAALRFRSNFCLTPYLEKAEIWDFPWSDNDLRVTRAIVLKRLLQDALTTTANPKVRGQAVLSARIFDLNLYLIDQVERERRRVRSEQAQQQNRTILTQCTSRHDPSTAARFHRSRARAGRDPKAGLTMGERRMAPIRTREKTLPLYEDGRISQSLDEPR